MTEQDAQDSEEQPRLLDPLPDRPVKIRKGGGRTGTTRAVGTVAAGDYDIGLEVVLRPAAVPELIGYSIRNREGKPIADKTRRELERQLNDVVDWFAATMAAIRMETVDISGGTLTLRMKGHDPVSTVLEGGSLRGVAVDADVQDVLLEDIGKRRQRRDITPELLAEVAELYRSANPRNPTESVADYYKVGKSTASRWIRAARDAGLLEPPPARRPRRSKTEETS